MKRFELRADKISLERFLEVSLWRIYWKLTRLEAWRSVSDQFQTEVIGQRVSQGDGPEEKGLESTHPWEVEPTEGAGAVE